MHTRQNRPKSPGLKWRERQGGAVPYWFADSKAVLDGYPIRSRNLSNLASDPAQLIEAAQLLQRDLLAWLAGDKKGAPQFDGTFKALLQIYETDPESTYNAKIKKHTRQSYATYVRKLIVHVGPRRIEECDGRDVNRWFKQWKETWGLGAARTAYAVLKSAVSFGIICRIKGCAEFKAILSELKFETLPSRTHAPTADQITAIRKAAHVAGRPRAALCYAIQFETSLRQWDVIGQWVGLDDPHPSAVLAYGKKWIGPTWAAIDNNLIMARVTPTKTEDSTEVTVSFDLSECPMICEELALIPIEQRVGPLIVNAATGLPYIRQSWRNAWRDDFDKAKLPPGMWNRDLRSASVTEGRKAGASLDDLGKVAGHTKKETTEIYDRDQVEAHRRIMRAKKQFRAQNSQ